MISDDTFRCDPFENKSFSAAMIEGLNELHAFHSLNCPQYSKLVSALFEERQRYDRLSDFPFLPVALFKSHDLLSVPRTAVSNVLTSSGTTGQLVSRIFLDKQTAYRQSLALHSIMKQVFGPSRLPMLIIDHSEVVKPGSDYSARGAGVLGLMKFGRHHTFALRPDMSIDTDAVSGFLEKYGDAPFAMFGFTFMVWEHFLKSLRVPLDLSNGLLVHSGGWKKLEEKAVDSHTFNRELRSATNLMSVTNFYGMVEQVGSVFLERADGFLHVPSFADVIIRDSKTWEPLPIGQPGVVQVLSLLPSSYPGHSLLTEDLGVLEESETGRGTAFRVLGRLPRTELRGCSDTHAANFGAETLGRR
jgi:hypothetical protein